MSRKFRAQGFFLGMSRLAKLHGRRQVIHLNLTAHPTAEWTARQPIEAFPEDSAPRYLLRDRDQIFGEEFRLRVKGMQIEEVITAPRSPFQDPYAEHVIGSIRRECFDHLIIIGEDQLRSDTDRG
jgi:putative transposase